MRWSVVANPQSCCRLAQGCATHSLHLSVVETRLTVCDNVCIIHEVQNILHRMLLPVTTQHFSSRSPASSNIYRCNTYIRRPAFATLLHHTSELKSLYLR
jgi:hypothetical protein